MQFEDVRAVLRLPQAQALGTTGGGNFLAASALMAIICGASTLFYDAGPHAFQYPYRSQQRFLDVLGYMPWDANASGIQRGAGSKRLWQFARNPLTHAFGVSYSPGKATGHVPNNLLGSPSLRPTCPETARHRRWRRSRRRHQAIALNESLELTYATDATVVEDHRSRWARRRRRERCHRRSQTAYAPPLRPRRVTRTTAPPPGRSLQRRPRRGGIRARKVCRAPLTQTRAVERIGGNSARMTLQTSATRRLPVGPTTTKRKSIAEHGMASARPARILGCSCRLRFKWPFPGSISCVGLASALPHSLASPRP
jgi:hypothetical protein